MPAEQDTAFQFQVVVPPTVVAGVTMTGADGAVIVVVKVLVDEYSLSPVALVAWTW